MTLVLVSNKAYDFHVVTGIPVFTGLATRVVYSHGISLLCPFNFKQGHGGGNFLQSRLLLLQYCNIVTRIPRPLLEDTVLEHTCTRLRTRVIFTRVHVYRYTCIAILECIEYTSTYTCNGR